MWRQIHKVLGMQEISLKELYSRSRAHGTDDTAASSAAENTEEPMNQNDGQTDQRMLLTILLHPRLTYCRWVWTSQPGKIRLATDLYGEKLATEPG